MKILLFAAAMFLGVFRSEAANFRLDGDLTWEITEPRLTFKLAGNLVDLTNGTSGTIKPVLWASSQPSYLGSDIGEYTLGQIDGGNQFNDLSGRTTSNIPSVTGNYYFNITVLEYTTAGWRNRLIVPGGSATLIKGDFVTQQKWKISTNNVTSPPAALAYGRSLNA